MLRSCAQRSLLVRIHQTCNTIHASTLVLSYVLRIELEPSSCRYGDLSTRNLLLLLVAKGRLGDTFPSTFRGLDMRARYRPENGSPAVMMSTLVQELGRLCRYAKVDATGVATEEIPYALVSPRTPSHHRPPINLFPGLSISISSMFSQSSTITSSVAQHPCR